MAENREEVPLTALKQNVQAGASKTGMDACLGQRVGCWQHDGGQGLALPGANIVHLIQPGSLQAALSLCEQVACQCC